MHSVRLQETLVELVESAAAALQADVLAGAEVAFELEPRSTRRGASGPALYCYRPLTEAFIAERLPELQRLPTYAPAAAALEGFDGLERYLAVMGREPAPGRPGARARAALGALLGAVFAEQTDFQLRPERMDAALAQLERAALADGGAVTLVATLHGLTITTPELALARGLTIAHPDALEGLPAEALAGEEGRSTGHLVAALVLEEDDPRRAARHGREVFKELLRALRLFGDGRVMLGALAWIRAGEGGWSPLALGAGGRPHGMLLVTADQEDELRAFCSLVSRRAPEGDELAWALRRFELGCEREHPYEALSDHLLALRALLEPEGPASGMLAGRLAALCATTELRQQLTERTVAALSLEREIIEGTAVEHAAGAALVGELADHLRALLRDVICGHLDRDLAALADQILLEPVAAGEGQPVAESAEQMLGDPSEAPQVLDLSV